MRFVTITWEKHTPRGAVIVEAPLAARTGIIFCTTFATLNRCLTFDFGVQRSSWWAK